jgi:hypothetical protein
MELIIGQVLGTASPLHTVEVLELRRSSDELRTQVDIVAVALDCSVVPPADVLRIIAGGVALNNRSATERASASLCAFAKSFDGKIKVLPIIVLPTI